MMIDTNVSLSRWPFRRLRYDDVTKLVQKLQTLGVTQAWAGSFDALLHRDVAGVNERLSDDCRANAPGFLLPFGTVNPTLPDWREDLRRCHEVHRMPGIRLHPSYHGYQLVDPACAELLHGAALRGLLVQLVVRMEDVRTQHPLVRVPDVKVGPLADVVARCPQLRLILLNAGQLLRSDTVKALVGTERVFFDIATLEGVDSIARILGQIPLAQLLMGSHFPFFILESVLLKLRESQLSEAQFAAITHQNAQRLLPPS